MDNKCVCCGTEIPEGRMVCPNCEARAQKLEPRRRYGSHLHSKLYAYEASKKCDGCRYAKNMRSAKDDLAYYCDYLLMTGHRRPCASEACRGWNKETGEWRGPGPEPIPDKR